MKVIEALNKFEYRGAGAFATWLFRIAHNEVNQHYRTQQRAGWVSLDDMPEIESAGLRPDDAFVRKEQFARLLNALKLLSPRLAKRSSHCVSSGELRIKRSRLYSTSTNAPSPVTCVVGWKT